MKFDERGKDALTRALSDEIDALVAEGKAVRLPWLGPARVQDGAVVFTVEGPTFAACPGAEEHCKKRIADALQAVIDRETVTSLEDLVARLTEHATCQDDTEFALHPREVRVLLAALKPPPPCEEAKRGTPGRPCDSRREPGPDPRRLR